MYKILKMAGILAAGIAAGLIGLFLVYLLPVRPMQEHMRESLTEFMEEGENPFLLKGLKGSSLDNYTDAIMLGSAVYEDEMPFWQSAVRVPRAAAEEDAPMESLDHYLSGGTDDRREEYTRYWHGYLLFLKPLLLILNYGQIRAANGCLQLVLVLWILYEFIKRGMKRGAAAYVLAILSMFPVVFPFSLQFSTAFYIGNIALLLVLKRHEKLDRTGRYPYFFLIVGMCTSYFDFLTYPVFTFGMPLALCMVWKRDQAWKEGLLFLVQSGTSWGCGYFLMWMGKWTVGSLVAGENFWTNALSAVSTRMSGEAYGETTGRILAVLRNGYIYFNIAGVLFALIVLLWMGVQLKKQYGRISLETVWPLLLIACIPLMWYLAASNHSYVHYWYAFRSLAVSVFALALIPECTKSENGEKTA